MFKPMEHLTGIIGRELVSCFLCKTFMPWNEAVKEHWVIDEDHSCCPECEKELTKPLDSQHTP